MLLLANPKFIGWFRTAILFYLQVIKQEMHIRRLVYSATIAPSPKPPLATQIIKTSSDNNIQYICKLSPGLIKLFFKLPYHASVLATRYLSTNSRLV